MTISSPTLPTSLYRQQGFVFKLIHSLLLVVIVVSLLVLLQMGKIPFLQFKPEWPDFSSNSSSHLIQTQYTDPVTQPLEDTLYTENRYTVQVAAGYDSRQLYNWRDELNRTGYDAYLVSQNTPKGLLFKLRVGTYNKRHRAERLRDKLQRRYPNNFGDSFIVEGD